jgi:hypothetical protein
LGERSRFFQDSTAFSPHPKLSLRSVMLSDSMPLARLPWKGS